VRGDTLKSKYKVFFRRVSSKGQDLEMQISADAMYTNMDELSKSTVSLDKVPKFIQLIGFFSGLISFFTKKSLIHIGSCRQNADIIR